MTKKALEQERQKKRKDKNKEKDLQLKQIPSPFLLIQSAYPSIPLMQLCFPLSAYQLKALQLPGFIFGAVQGLACK